MKFLFGAIMLGIYLLILYNPYIEKLPNKRYIIYYTPLWGKETDRKKIII